MSLRAELSQQPTWGATSSPWDGYERSAGHGVTDQPFSSGHGLAFRRDRYG